MKRILTALCALALVTAGALPAFAAESPAPTSSPAPAPEPELSCYYPISVEEYTAGPLDELRVSKVYQLSLSDNPGQRYQQDGRHPPAAGRQNKLSPKSRTNIGCQCGI